MEGNLSVLNRVHTKPSLGRESRDQSIMQTLGKCCFPLSNPKAPIPSCTVDPTNIDYPMDWSADLKVPSVQVSHNFVFVCMQEFSFYILFAI